MSIIVKDIIHFRDFEGLKLIAGEGGLDRIVTKCGILDYEYDNSVKNKFLYKNFEEGQFVLTSFLYAKENEYLIIEALKNLVGRKVVNVNRKILHIIIENSSRGEKIIVLQAIVLFLLTYRNFHSYLLYKIYGLVYLSLLLSLPDL